jgi:uncharacterized membrane protein
MTTLTVWKFDSEGGARGALQVLERLRKQELLQVVDAAIVTSPPDRKKPKTEQLRSRAGRARSVARSGVCCSGCSSSSH